MQTQWIGLICLSTGLLALTACGGPKFEDERETCDSYIACATTNAPDTLTGVLESYGEDSVCWDGDVAATACAAACATALDTCEDVDGDSDSDSDSEVDTEADTEEDSEVIITDSDVDTGPDFFDEREVLVQSVSLDCSGDDADLVVTYDGWADSVTVDTRGTFGGTGSASVVLSADSNVEFCPDGSCDRWEATLSGDELSAPCSDYQVTDGRYENAAIRISGVADSNDQTMECVIFGRGSRAEYGDACTCSEAWLFNPPADPCGD